MRLHSVSTFLFSILFLLGLPNASLLASDDEFNLAPANRAYYQPSTWQPRAILPADDALSGTFWPKSPEVHVTYVDPGFDASRLSRFLRREFTLAFS